MILEEEKENKGSAIAVVKQASDEMPTVVRSSEHASPIPSSNTTPVSNTSELSDLCASLSPVLAKIDCYQPATFCTPIFHHRSSGYTEPWLSQSVQASKTQKAVGGTPVTTYRPVPRSAQLPYRPLETPRSVFRDARSRTPASAFHLSLKKTISGGQNLTWPAGVKSSKSILTAGLIANFEMTSDFTGQSSVFERTAVS